MTNADSTASPPICFLLRYFTVGGLERVVSALANTLVDRGIDVRIVVLSSGKRNALITELDPRIDLALLDGPWRQRLEALRRLTSGRLVHIHFGDGYTHPRVRAALKGRTTIVTYHSVYSHKRTWMRNRIDQFWAARTDGIVAVSDAVKAFCVDEVGISADRVTVIPNAVPRPDDSANGTATSAPPLALLSLASLYPHKNQEAVIRGLAAARRCGLDARLSIVGDGPVMASLYQLSIALGIQPDIDWYGAVWRRDMVQPLIAASHAFVSASRFEGMPLSVLEAMSFDLPLVLSDIPPHRQVAGTGALYFSPDDPEALAEHLIALDSESLRAELSEASRLRIGDFDLDTCVDRYVEVYQQYTPK